MPSPLRFLKSGPPPPKVALLPDALFFTRSVPVANAATQAEAAAQVELALESMSPFPLAQLYYGWYWVPGATRALVFAAYRRRFTAEQTAEWDGSELVLPAFAAVLGADVDAGTTVVLDTPEGVTAVHWADLPVPERVVVRPVDPEATDDDRQRLKEEILREVGGSRKVVEIDAAISADSSATDREVSFRAGDLTSIVPSGIASALDVRDKAELVARRSARRRDVMLWRLVVGAAAVLLFLVLGESALVAGRAWHGVRERLYLAQKPRVDKIVSIHELTNRIEDLATKRLLPMEMVTQVVGENSERIPPDIQFTRVHAEQGDQGRGLFTLYIDGKTENAAQVNAYEAALKNLPSVQSASATFAQTRGTQATFSIVVVFKPGALNPTSTTVVSAR